MLNVSKDNGTSKWTWVHCLSTIHNFVETYDENEQAIEYQK